MLCSCAPTAPAGVKSPAASAIDRRSIAYVWQLPDDPSGHLLRYALIINHQTAYNSTDTSARSFVHSNLLPFTDYRAVLRACTIAGCADSTSILTKTLTDTPEGIGAPLLTADSEDSIEARWSPPAKPNGVIIRYQLLQGNQTLEVVFDGDGTSRRAVVRNLQAAEEYTYRLRVYTSAGSSLGPGASVTTLEDVPSDIESPILLAPSSDKVLLFWKAPLTPNGAITSYGLQRDGVRLSANLSATTLTYEDRNVQPYTVYAYAIVACTAIGCAVGNESSIQTAESVPQGVQPAQLTVASANTIFATWPTVQQPNGVVTYKLFVHGPQLSPGGNSATAASFLVTDSADAGDVVNVTGLVAYSLYAAVVQASTSVGSANSTLSTAVRTSEAGEW